MTDEEALKGLKRIRIGLTESIEKIERKIRGDNVPQKTYTNDDNPKLKLRIQRITKTLLGKHVAYYPRSVSANKNLEVGEQVKVLEVAKTRGSENMVKVEQRYGSTEATVFLADLAR